MIDPDQGGVEAWESGMSQYLLRVDRRMQPMAAAHARGVRPRPALDNLDAYLDIGAAFDHDSAEIGMAPDYHGFYRAALAKRHRQRPMRADFRLWSGEDEAAELNAPAAEPELLKRSA